MIDQCLILMCLPPSISVALSKDNAGAIVFASKHIEITPRVPFLGRSSMLFAISISS
jgi:hypothetical protein